MYTLYYSPGVCSMAVHVLLNEMDVPFRLVSAKMEDGSKNPDFLKVNPRGAVPALQVGDQLILEGAAILLYLAEKHDSELLPKENPERMKALQMLMFANATLHPAYSRVFFLKKSGETGEGIDRLLQSSYDNINKLWAEVDSLLAETPYVCGDHCTLADILLTVIANWTMWLPDAGIETGAHCKAMFARVVDRPAYRKALATENVQYQAAA